MFARTARPALALILAFSCLPALADVTIRSKIAMSGMMSMQGESTTYIKGHKMRIESTIGGKTSVMLMDIDARQTIIIDGKKAEAFDLSKMMKEQAMIDGTSVNFDVQSTGKKREIAGQSCDEHQVTIVVKAQAAQDNPMGNMDIKMSGPGCMVKGAPGTDEYLAFYTHAASVGYFFGDPRAAQAQPGRERAMTLAYKKMAEAGFPYYSSFKMSFEGGPMAAMMEKMAMNMESTVTSVSTESLADDLFTVPAGMKVKNK